MAFITEYWIIDTLLILSFLLIILCHYLKSIYNYWKDRNVPFAKPKIRDIEFILGKAHYIDMLSHIYKEFESERFCGFYQMQKPALMIRDPKLIEQILIKDFSHFEDRGLPLDEENEPLSVNLVNLSGDKWRSLRHKLTPTFTSGKLKGMFEQMSNCGEIFLKIVEKYAISGEEVDTKPLTAIFSSDIITSCAFGLQIHPDSPEGKQFSDMVNKALGNSSSTIFLKLLTMFFPKLCKILGIKFVPSDVSEYFIGITKATMDHRLKNNIRREDFLQLLLTLKQQEEAGHQVQFANDVDQEDIQLQFTNNVVPEKNNLNFTDELIAAQSFVFFAAGSESVSSTLSIALYHLAEHTEVQRKLQAEVDSVMVKHNGQWSYQALKEMTYLDQVIQESQRLFPIAQAHVRVCTSSYKIPDSDVVIEEGVSVVVPITSIHRDPTHYHNPEVFDPERFVNNNFKPSPTFSPFGDGPRICIAMSFAVLEIKVFLARLMSKYTVKLSPKTLTPLRYDPKSLHARVKGGVWISFQSRKR